MEVNVKYNGKEVQLTISDELITETGNSFEFVMREIRDGMLAGFLTELK